MSSGKRPLRFITTDGGCFVCVSHKVNQDGYFRKRWKGAVEMFHRFIYRAHFGEIPAGFEVDHICRNRACCNPGHLRALSKADHLIHTNKTRYSKRKDTAKSYWIDHRCTGTRLATVAGVSLSSACRWIREWKSQECN